MSKNLFALSAVLSAAFFVGCSSGPTIIDSTRQKRDGEKPASNVLTSKSSVTSDSPNHGNANHETATHSETSHSEMSSAPSAASQPFDLQFLDTMIAHHDGAIQMGRAATTKSTNADLKAFADKIVADQTRETIEMKKWREQWYENKPSALNMEMAGMTASMKGMDAPKLSQTSGDAYNLEFVNQMIPHHEGALAMAKEAAAKAEHAEIKTLANQIIKEQEAEIKQMQTWKTQWTK